MGENAYRPFRVIDLSLARLKADCIVVVNEIKCTQKTGWSPLKDKIVWTDITMKDIFEGDETGMS